MQKGYIQTVFNLSCRHSKLRLGIKFIANISLTTTNGTKNGGFRTNALTVTSP